MSNDSIVESWLCVDCGVNTAPGIPDGATMRAHINLTGVCNTKLTPNSEIYAVRHTIWARAGMQPWGGCLCVGCLEKRLGRKLKPKDFPRANPLNWPNVPRSERLANRLGFKS